MNGLYLTRFICKDESLIKATIEHRSNLNETKKNTAKWKNRVFDHEMTRMQAVDLFQNESLDFIYIDARHDYKAVWDDLEAWFPKLRKGGLFSGHDYVDAD